MFFIVESGKFGLGHGKKKKGLARVSGRTWAF